MSDFENFKEELSLKEKFYSLLTNRKLSDKEYEHVLNVWKKIEMKTMKDCHNLYLKCDVLLLADVLNKFRNNSFKNYGLFPSHYLSAPGLSRDAMLKITKIKHGFVSDSDIDIFFEKGTRGGISYISHRCSKVNNKYLQSYDPKQESKDIIHLDPDNLYGYSMFKNLPTRNSNG